MTAGGGAVAVAEMSPAVVVVVEVVVDEGAVVVVVMLGDVVELAVPIVLVLGALYVELLVSSAKLALAVVATASTVALTIVIL